MKAYNLVIIFSVISLGCDSSGDSNDSVINYPSEKYISLQEAVNVLPSGSSINVEKGLYQESIIIQDKVIHLHGDMKQSVIDGQGSSCITIINASGSTVSGFAIVNCNDGITTQSKITISDNYFFNNVDSVDYEGGGGLLENNIFHMSKDDAVDLDNDTAVDINNNVISGSNDDGIEIRLHPYNGIELKINIQDNIFKDNNSNGIQIIDYEVDTDRSFDIKGNTFIESGYSEISYSDNQVTTPSLDIGEISESVNISSNTFYPLVYSFTGSGDNTVFENNFIYSLAGDGNINTTSEFPVDNNTFIQIY